MAIPFARPWMFETVLHIDGDSISIPRQFYRAWRHPLGRWVLMHDFADNNFVGFIKVDGDRARIETTTDKIRFMYQLNEGVVIKFQYMGRNRLIFSIPLPNGGIVTPLSADEWVDPNENLEPLWAVNVTRPLSTGRQSLHIPAHVVKSSLEHEPDDIEVILPGGDVKTWSIKFNHVRRSCYFVHGWYDFAKDAVLYPGDVLYFRKTPNNALFVVTINEDDPEIDDEEEAGD